MTTEVIILAVSGIVASGLYISRHLITSKCWTKEECCSIRLRANSQSKLPAVVTEEPITLKEAEPKTYVPPTLPPPAFVSSVV